MGTHRTAAVDRPSGRPIVVLAATLAAVAATLVPQPPAPLAAAPASHRSRAAASCDPSTPPTCTLRELADRLGVRIGSILDADTLADPDHTTTLAREFNALTPENGLKWYAVQNQRGTFDFTVADAVVSFAEQHDMEVRGHALVWSQDRFTPDWVEAITDPAEMRAELETHIAAVMGRYRDRIHRWDVVNEPLQSLLDGPGTAVGDNAYRRALGDRWIDEVFAMARAQDPDAELWLNEYGSDWAPGRHDALLDLLRELLDRGVPIDGIGLQTHRLGPDGPDGAVFARQLRDYAALGLRVAITEVDVPTSPDDPEALERQAYAYGTIVGGCLAVAACEEVTTWGISDADTWLASPDFAVLPQPTRPLLFDDEFRPKPAYAAVRDALAAGRPPGPPDSPPGVPASGPAPAVPAAAVPAAPGYTG